MIYGLKPYPEYKVSGVPASKLRHADAVYVQAAVKIGYEISFNRYFYKAKALRLLEEIRADLLAVEKETEGMLAEILGGTNHE